VRANGLGRAVVRAGLERMADEGRKNCLWWEAVGGTWYAVGFFVLFLRDKGLFFKNTLVIISGKPIRPLGIAMPIAIAATAIGRSSTIHRKETRLTKMSKQGITV